MNKAKTLRIKRAQLLKGYHICNNSRTNVTQAIFISKVMFSSRRKMAFS